MEFVFYSIQHLLLTDHTKCYLVFLVSRQARRCESLAKVLTDVVSGDGGRERPSLGEEAPQVPHSTPERFLLLDHSPVTNVIQPTVTCQTVLAQLINFLCLQSSVCPVLELIVQF